MKLGPLDGSFEEVRDLLENNGLKLEDYLERPIAPLKTRFLIIPIVLFVLSLGAMAALIPSLSIWLLKLLYIPIFGSITWTCASIQIRFKNGIATFCVATGLLSPREAADILKELKGK
ncbi:MAG: hypothetical protein KKH04_14345 [Proteobacteria bacterium]|nr:hypothetical protein [Pseudomonadota bacterium]